MTDVAIVGASGYAARELIRILLSHPGAGSRRRPRGRTRRPGSTPSTRAWPAGSTWPASRSTPTGSPSRRSVAFLALPHTASMAVVPQLAQARGPGHRPERRLSAERRRRSTPTGTATRTPTPTGLREAVYGLPELFRDADPVGEPDRQPRLLHLDEHPGLAPLIAEDRIERTGIIIDAKSGVSGRGGRRS